MRNDSVLDLPQPRFVYFERERAALLLEWSRSIEQHRLDLDEWLALRQTTAEHIKPERCQGCGAIPPEWTAADIVAAIRAWTSHGEPPTGKDWERAGYGHPRRRTVIQVFGTWNNAIRAAGLEPRKWGTKDGWGKEQIIDAIQRWAREHGGKPPRVLDWQCAGPNWPSASITIKKFGTWNKAIDAAGFFPRWSRMQYTNPERTRRVA